MKAWVKMTGVSLAILLVGCSVPEREPGAPTSVRKPISADWNDGRYNERNYRPVHLQQERNCVRIISQKRSFTRC